MTPCNLSEVYRLFGGIYYLHIQCLRVNLLFIYCLLLIVLKMVTAHSSETSVNFYQTTRRYITEHPVLMMCCGGTPYTEMYSQVITKWPLWSASTLYY
jgi:hypothetical protein